jgi:multidrug resistance efflux pump
MEDLQEDLKIYSEEVRDVLSAPPKAIFKFGNTILLGFIIILAAFSYYMKYPDIVRTQVVITTESPPEKLIARTSGKISEIFVADRSQVQPKTALAIIENTANYADILKLKNCIDTISVNGSEFIFPFEKFSVLQLGEVQNSFTLFEKDYIAYDLNRNLKPYSVEKTAQSAETNQLKQRLTLAQQQFKISQNELQLKKQELERFRKLYEKGVIATQEWESKSLDYLQSEKNVRNISTQLSQMRSSINDLKRSSGNTRISESKDNINLLRNVLQSFSQLKKAINDWELMYVLSSSIKGEVSFMQIWVKNQTINSGEQVFTIVPADKKNYIAKVKAPAQNAGKIKLNQTVNIRLANYPDREFGMIKGKIKSISLTPDIEGNLLIDVDLPNGIATSYNKKINFQQEMSGTADIVTEDLRLIERLLYQFRGIFRR